MKIKVEIWFPETTQVRTEREIEIPDGTPDIWDWIYINEKDIVKKESMEDFEGSVFDLGYAGVQMLKQCRV